jgi:hypothetical protein
LPFYFSADAVGSFAVHSIMKYRQSAVGALNFVRGVVTLPVVLPLMVGILTFIRERISLAINYPSLAKLVAATISWTMILVVASIILPCQSQKQKRTSLVPGSVSFFVNKDEATIATVLYFAYGCCATATGVGGDLWPNVSSFLLS